MFRNVMLELTYRCNLRCSFCYLAPCGRLNRPGAELGTDEFLRIIDRFPGAGFYLSGGEPLLREDLFEIAEHIKKSGSGFGLNTNGLLLTPAKARRLAALKPDYVIFSLHGTERVHDRLTGRKGAWRALMRNMENFAAAAAKPTEVVACCVVNRENAGCLSGAYLSARRAGARRVLFEHLQFLKPEEAAKLPAGLRRGGVLTPVLEGYRADPSLIAAQFAAIGRQELSGGPERSAHFETRPLMRGRELEQYYNGTIRPVGACPRLTDTINIEPDGSVRLCVLYGVKAGHALRTDLKKLLAMKKRLVRSGLPSGCARCCHRFQAFRHF